MFYVYELVDPRDGSVYYVGKGKGSRRFAHEKEARKGKDSAKCARIRDIIDAGHQFQSRIIRSFASEDDAYHFEVVHIASFEFGCLTNVAKGGHGGRHRRNPVAEARAIVDRFHAVIRGALELGRGGYRLMAGKWDLTDCCLELADSLRAKVGDEYFDSKVWA